MPTIDDLIDLTITVTDKAPSKPNFGTPLIAAYHTAWVDRVREYTDADELLDDGFSESSAVYKLAVLIKSQSPCPRTFKVGRLSSAHTQTIHLIPTITTEGYQYVGEINGTAITYTVPAAATVLSIVEAMEPSVEAVTGVSSSEDDTKIIVTPTTPGDLNTFSFDRGMHILDATAEAGSIATDLAAIAEEDNEWYGLLLDCNSSAIVTAAAGWVETQRKILIAQSADWDIVDAGETNDLASDLVALALTRTAGIWHRSIGRQVDGLAAGWLGLALAFDPGTITWAFKTIAGAEVDELRAGERSALATKKWTHYERTNGVNITFEGRTPSGRFIDVTHFVDWLHAEIQADVYSLLVNNPKVPYTTTGIGMVKNAVLGALIKGQQRGGLADDTQPTVTAPEVTETDAADRANRILRDVEFTARLSGALHSIVITGTVSV